MPSLRDNIKKERKGHLPVPILPDLFYCGCTEMKRANEVNNSRVRIQGLRMESPLEFINWVSPI